jgi:hypothetical protein
MPEDAGEEVEACRMEKRHDVLNYRFGDSHLCVIQIRTSGLALGMKGPNRENFPSARETHDVRPDPETGGGAISTEVLDPLGGEAGFRSVFFFGEGLK